MKSGRKPQQLRSSDATRRKEIQGHRGRCRRWRFRGGRHRLRPDGWGGTPGGTQQFTQMIVTTYMQLSASCGRDGVIWEGVSRVQCWTRRGCADGSLGAGCREQSVW
ncbi:hypothetical protein HYPSUDRAFT_1046254 [Hypholoma sublateritium FD-334 SS-4]|uniref:Uncharacterized protein n=1 Tax=Hypholoma sublateritium (strain FD-334 SS-4) TaxID=945553 RepID=A0A0D2KQV9_HYPSF|nr:hypothetical protein HYPSUDRAFT_1046254 [Hypholoma sublateritium FD-334 SS-4]